MREAKTAPAKPVDLVAIRARADGASEGPWIHSGGVFADGSGAMYINTQHYSAATELDLEDALFAAHARTDVPAMADEIEALRKALDELLEVVEPTCTAECDNCHVQRLRALLPPS